MRILQVAVSLLVGFILFTSLFAQKPPTQNRHLEIIPDEIEASYRTENLRVSRETGAPLALYRIDYPVEPAPPLEMAQQYLLENAQLLHLKNGISDLVHTSTRETPGGYHVRLQQYASGYPVYKAEIVVNINRRNMVTFVMNGYKPGVKLDRQTPALSAAAASQIAKNYMDIRGRLDYEKTELIVYHLKGKSRLVYRVALAPAEDTFGDWEILIDAFSGGIIKAADNAVYGDRSRNTASGWVFDPDPLTRARAVYGGQFADNNDNDTDSLTAQLAEVPLLDVTFSGGQYHLNGPYARIMDFEAPFKGLFSQADSNFHYTRSPDAFEAANVYYHVDKSMRYINETLGFNLMPFQYTGGVQVDPHGLNGDDNSHYIPSTGRIAWGEGGVDDAEDEDVILHELGHGIHDWLTNGSLSQVQGLSEGCGDYWAASYNRSTGFWQPGDPQYYWVFQWDGHNPFWSGRITNYTAQYPGGLTGQIHTDGQIWSSTLMQIWDDIGREATDSNFLEALSMTSSSTNQEDAAQAFIQADINLYNGIHLTQIEYWFTQRGYNVTVPAPAITHSPLSDTEDLVGPYTVIANIASGLPLATVELIFGTNGIFTDTLDMTPNGNQYSAQIPGTGNPTNYNYYIFAADSNAIASTSPPGAPGNYYQFYAGPDTVAPVISHTPLRDQPYLRWPSVVKAEIEDNLGIASAWVEYSVNSGTLSGSFPLLPAGDNLYEGAFDIDTAVVAIGDSIAYRIVAEDSATLPNQAAAPTAGFYHFKIVDILGVILVIDDDPTTATVKMTERGLRVRDINAHPFGVSANRMAANLSDVGYLTAVEDAGITDPSTWGNYDLIISSSGINETTLSSTAYRNALVTYSQNGGKFIIEGGEVGWDWRNDTQVMSYLLHSDSWGGDNAGTLHLMSGLSNHPMVNEPNLLPSSIGITYTVYGSEDAMSATDSYVLYETTTDPGYAGISIYDDNANPLSAQSVYYAFNFAQVTDTTVAKKLLENTVNYLLTPETTNQAPVVLSPLEDIVMAEDDPDLTAANLDTVFHDPDGDPLDYSATSSDSSVMVSIANDRFLIVSLAENWFGAASIRITASDQFSSVSDTVELTVTPVNDPPAAFNLVSPGDGDSLNPAQPIPFVWRTSVDVDDDTLSYTLHLSSASLDTFFSGIADTLFSLNGSGFLQNNTIYQWWVSASDTQYTAASLDTFSLFISDSVTGIVFEPEAIPTQFALHQNYPNPFNPSTTIRYDLPRQGHVELIIYNVLGQEVRTLVNEIQTAGYKSVVWDGTNKMGQRAASGIYIYRLWIRGVSDKTGAFLQSRKLLMLK